MYKRCGILCAGDTELAPFLKRLNETNRIEKAMLPFHEGTIHHYQMVAVYSGVCTVNAALTA